MARNKPNSIIPAHYLKIIYQADHMESHSAWQEAWENVLSMQNESSAGSEDFLCAMQSSPTPTIAGNLLDYAVQKLLSLRSDEKGVFMNRWDALSSRITPSLHQYRPALLKGIAAAHRCGSPPPDHPIWNWIAQACGIEKILPEDHIECWQSQNLSNYHEIDAQSCPSIESKNASKWLFHHCLINGDPQWWDLLIKAGALWSAKTKENGLPIWSAVHTQEQINAVSADLFSEWENQRISGLTFRQLLQMRTQSYRCDYKKASYWDSESSFGGKREKIKFAYRISHIVSDNAEKGSALLQKKETIEEFAEQVLTLLSPLQKHSGIILKSEFQTAIVHSELSVLKDPLQRARFLATFGEVLLLGQIRKSKLDELNKSYTFSADQLLSKPDPFVTILDIKELMQDFILKSMSEIVDQWYPDREKVPEEARWVTDLIDAANDCHQFDHHSLKMLKAKIKNPTIQLGTLKVDMEKVFDFEDKNTARVTRLMNNAKFHESVDRVWLKKKRGNPQKRA